jgi:hemerythrin-like domain-containing protein
LLYENATHRLNTIFGQIQHTQVLQMLEVLNLDYFVVAEVKLTQVYKLIQFFDSSAEDR